MAVLLLLPSAQVRGLDVPLCPAGGGGAGVSACIPRGPEFSGKMVQGLPVVQGGAEARPPVSLHLTTGLDLIPRFPVGVPLRAERQIVTTAPVPTLDFSISLLGKPPHSSIMSMATGKNLQSIPKKVSKAGPGFQASQRV